MTIIRIMSFNIFSPGDLEEGEELPPEEVPNSWEARAPLNLRTIKRYQPDLIGFQEMDDAKLAMYREQLDEYGFAEPGHVGDAPSIFWRRDRCELIEAGEFWLSRTPDEPSNDWDVPYPLRVDWIRLRMRDTGVELLHLNTQFEDGPWGEQSRVESSKLIVQRVAALQASQPASQIPIVRPAMATRPRPAPFTAYAAPDTFRWSGATNSSGAWTGFSHETARTGSKRHPARLCAMRSRRSIPAITTRSSPK